MRITHRMLLDALDVVAEEDTPLEGHTDIEQAAATLVELLEEAISEGVISDNTPIVSYEGQALQALKIKSPWWERTHRRQRRRPE